MKKIDKVIILSSTTRHEIYEGPADEIPQTIMEQYKPVGHKCFFTIKLMIIIAEERN